MLVKEFFYTSYNSIDQPKFEDEEDEDEKEYEKFIEQQSYKDQSITLKKFPNVNNITKEEVKGSGQLCLGIDQSFHIKVLLIKRHLEKPLHPITSLINLFKEQFFNDNIQYLEKAVEYDEEGVEIQCRKKAHDINKVLKSCTQ